MIRAKSPILFGAAGLLALTACTDTATPTSDPNQRAKEGALLGAVLGAAAGSTFGDSEEERRRGAAIGAVVGAGAGVAIGANLDRQAAELRQSMDSRVQIERRGNQLIVRLPQDVLFAVDSATVSPALRDDLARLATSLQNHPGTQVQVIGHTDNTGDASYNQGLSEERARSVAQILVSNGVRPRRINAFGRGETQPIATNLTPQGRAQNRRVEVVIIANRG